METQMIELNKLHEQQKQAINKIRDGLAILKQLDKKIELWKLIDGYDNYSVSSFGRVRNNKTGRILKKSIHGQGYYKVDLYKYGKAKSMNVHKLVINAFIDNVDDKLCVDHINNNKLDNNVGNLRYATNKENSQNRTMNKNNTSGVKGVSLNKITKKWQATIMIDGISIHLGLYDKLEDAKKARIERATKAFGNYTNACET
jgi:hypothetical protein